MKRPIILALFCTLACGALSAQPLETRESRVHISFFPPLSTNGRFAPEFTNDFSLNILAGISRNERAAAIAGLANIIKNDAQGVQFAGLYNGIGNAGTGAAFAGLLNTANSYAGVQFGGIYNSAGTFGGVQFGGLMNTAGAMQGVQFAGVSNIAGLLKSGAQFAGVMNIGGTVHGPQFAGVGNVAGHIRGAQFAGLFNKGGVVDGVQFAGLLNIAESSRASIALINIIGDGEMGIGLAYNEIGNVTATFRSGGRIFYGILGGGYNFQFDDGSFVLEGGLGARIYVSNRFRINNELKSAYIGRFESDETYHQSFSILPAFRITPKLEIFAGPSLNYLSSDNPELLGDFPSGTLWDKYGTENIKQLHVGFSAGMYFGF